MSRRINPKAVFFELQVRSSSLHGNGVFALENIPLGHPVIEYTGKRLSHDQLAKLRPPQDAYVATFSSKWFLDGRSGGSGAQFINHSCKPNLVPVVVGKRLLLYSLRKIRAGEELTWMYRYPIKLERVPCHCGARGCRGTLRYLLS
jgi:SET domain-containing protein